MNRQTYTRADVERGIVHHAQACEEALRLAAFAEAEPSLGAGMAAGLNKLAGFHSYHAFEWAATPLEDRR